MSHIVKSEMLGVPVISEVAKSGALATNYANLNNTMLGEIGKVTKALRDLPDASTQDTSSADAPAPAQHEL